MILNSSRKNLGGLLKEQRQSAKLTLYELSAASGVSPSHLGRIENGERFPSADILQRIAGPLGFGEEELFSLAGYLSPKKQQETRESRSRLDPYVARILSQEPVEIQRAALGILTILKSLSGDGNKNASVPNAVPGSFEMNRSGINAK
jgi:transcriptional regulator with XRE-family HTH domain